MYLKGIEGIPEFFKVLEWRSRKCLVYRQWFQDQVVPPLHYTNPKQTMELIQRSHSLNHGSSWENPFAIKDSYI